MVVSAIRFVALLLTALLVGTMFGLWIGIDPGSLSAAAHVELMHSLIRRLNVPLPLLGLACIVSTAALAVATRRDRRGRTLLIAAVVCLVTAALVTRFGNQPINAVVMTWTAQAPDASWTELRDTWWRWHAVRTLAGVLALALSLLAAVAHRDAPAVALPPRPGPGLLPGTPPGAAAATARR
jgi:uncharacterized membrane protein